MTDNSRTQLTMRICRVFAHLHPHGCVWHCYFLDMNHSAATLVIRANARKNSVLRQFTHALKLGYLGHIYFCKLDIQTKSEKIHLSNEKRISRSSCLQDCIFKRPALQSDLKQIPEHFTFIDSAKRVHFYVEDHEIS